MSQLPREEIYLSIGFDQQYDFSKGKYADVHNEIAMLITPAA
jgi:hypothetical protein